MANFSSIIITWYNKNKRDLPWRNTNDAYKIWLSEVILQQTRVAQGMSYYLKFIENYPTIQHLANAPQDDVLKLWQGLGYYSRARNLHTAAKQVVDEFGGEFPNQYHDILKLKGVGEYTAAAIASFASNHPHAVVDGNVYRVLARYYGVEIAINTNKAKKYFTELANEILDKKNAGLHNQAIMEFGALQCVPVSPNCSICPLINSCEAYNKNMVAQLPTKEKKLKVKQRFFNYFIIKYNNTTFIEQRPEGDIWQGLYQFPLLETDTESSVEEILNHDFFKQLIQTNNFTVTHVSNPVKHILTHRHIFCKFFEIEMDSVSKKSTLNSYLNIEIEVLKKYAIPRLIDRYLQQQNTKVQTKLML
jgi:A/G-specific adenine glycosylase